MSTIAAFRSERTRKQAEDTAKYGVKPKGGVVKKTVMKLTLAHLGVLAAIGGYFFLLQICHGQHTSIDLSTIHTTFTFPNIKGVWDSLLSRPISQGGFIQVLSDHNWTTIRHLVRPLVEGILAFLLYGFVVINPYKIRKKLAKKDGPSALTRFAMKLRFVPTFYSPVTALQIVMLPLTVILFAIPGIIVGAGVDQLFHLILNTHSLAPAISAHPSLVQKLYTGEFDAKIVGIFAGVFFARKPAQPVFLFALKFFAARRSLSNDTLKNQTRFYHLPAFKSLVEEYDNDPILARRVCGNHGAGVTRAMLLAIPVVLAFAGLGYWVLATLA